MMDTRSKRERLMDSQKERKISTKTTTVFKEEFKHKKKQKWRPQGNSSSKKLMMEFQPLR
jgi:hypothetical protein